MNLKELVLGFPTAKEKAAQKYIRLKEGKHLSAVQLSEISEARGITRRLLFRRVTLAAGYTALATLGIAKFTENNKSNYPKEYGKLKQVIPLSFENKDGTVFVEVVIFETERAFSFDHEALGKNASTIATRSGKLPPFTRIILSDLTIDPNNPSHFGSTRKEGDIRLSIKDGFKYSPFKGIYPDEAVLNGVLVGEMTNLMIHTSGTLPPGAGHVERLGDSTGIMASAIFAGRSHQEYLSDANLVEYTRAGGGGKIIFDERTYQDFQRGLRPALLFK